MQRNQFRRLLRSAQRYSERAALSAEDHGATGRSSAATANVGSVDAASGRLLKWGLCDITPLEVEDGFLLAPGAAVAAAAALDLPAPYSFWRLDESSGNRIDTGATAGNDLTPTAAPGNAAGTIGSAVALNGTTQELHNNTPSGMGLGSGVSFTIGMWVFATSLVVGDGTPLVSKNNVSTSVGYALFMNSSGFRAYAGTISSGVKTLNANGTTPVTNTWYNVTLRYDSPNKLLYIRVNDSTESAISTVTDIADPGTAFMLGHDNMDATFFPGRIDAVAYWPQLLTPTELTNFYRAGAGREYYSGAWQPSS